MRKRSTKSALLSSALALFLCFAMLLGTTFAWFTDSVESGTNKIVAGNLDIELKYAQIKDGAITSWEAVQGQELFDPNALWEPGRVEVVYLEVSNLGTLDLKYQLGVNVEGIAPGTSVLGNAIDLTEYLNFKVVPLDAKPTVPYTREKAIEALGEVQGFNTYNGKTTTLLTEEVHYVALVVYMPTTVGNEANYDRSRPLPSITFGVKLQAAQLTSEEDSFGSDYDEEAPLPLISSAQELKIALESGRPLVKLGNDIELDVDIVIPANVARAATQPITLKMNGYSITAAKAKANGAMIINNGHLIIDGGTSAKMENTAVNGAALIENHGTLVLNGGQYIGAPSDTATGTASYAINTAGVGSSTTVNGAAISGRGAIGATNGAQVELNGGTYHTPAVAWGHAVYAVDEGTEVVINDGTFSEGYEMAADNWGMYQIYSGNKATVKVYGGTFEDWDCANGYDLCTAGEGTIEIYGGTFAEDPSNQNGEDYLAPNHEAKPENGKYTVYPFVAKVGNNSYTDIDEAIAAWTNGTTLTLLNDVTLNDVIKLSSTEYHILDLGTYTMTAAKGKDAIQYVVNGRSSASYALDIKADAENPGGITATGKTIVSHIKPESGAPAKDRPITRFYGGVFNASYIVKQGGSGRFLPGAGYTGASAPYFQFYGGEFNGTIYTNRSQNQFHGGIFNGSLQMSVDSSAYTLIAGGTFKQLSNAMGSTLNSDKFVIGSAKGANNGSVCIDENGYYVITTTTPSGAEASVASNYNSNNYFYYSTVNTNGMYYANVYDALNAKTTGEVTVFVDSLDMTGSAFKGTILIEDTLTVTFAEGTTPAWTVASGVDGKTVSSTDTTVDGVVTVTYTLS